MRMRLHFFYNAESLQFVVLLQAALTLLGNTTLAFAAWRLAVSNGWTFSLPKMGDGDNGAESKTVPAEMDESSRGTFPAASASSSLVDSSGGDLGGLLVIFAWSSPATRQVWRDGCACGRWRVAGGANRGHADDCCCLRLQLLEVVEPLTREAAAWLI